MTDDESVILGDIPPSRLDPSRSMKIAEIVPMTLDESRKKDPQGTIDYLFARKEAYKKGGIAQHQRALAAEKKLAELEKTLRTRDEELEAANRLAKLFRSKYKKEQKMKSNWRFACIGTGIGAAFLAVLLVVFSINGRQPQQQQPTRNDGLKVPTSGTSQTTPAHILASVNIFNGKIQGSGTVISKGKTKAAILTAAHNFSGKIGGEFFVYYPDGTYAKATLLAHDPGRDLAVASVDADTIIEHSYIPEGVPQTGTLSGVGYTGGQGPNYRTLAYTGAYYNAASRRMWEMNVTAGPFWDGDSGGGVFLDDATIGVTSQRDSLVSVGNNCYVRRMYAISHAEIVAFLTENKAVLADCGDWREKPEQKFGGDGPPLWKPSPNVPIHVGGNEPSVKELRAEIEELKKRVPAQPKLSTPLVPDDGLKKPSDVPKK